MVRRHIPEVLEDRAIQCSLEAGGGHGVSIMNIW